MFLVPDADKTLTQNMPVLIEKMRGYLQGTLTGEHMTKENPESEAASLTEDNQDGA